MKKAISCFVVMAVIFCLAGIAQADPKWVNAVPSCMGNTVTIPPMPAGTELLNVQIYHRDEKGTRNTDLGPVHTFELDPNNVKEGFNFTYRDQDGVWWQMITEYTPAVNGIGPDCSRPTCIYVRK